MPRWTTTLMLSAALIIGCGDKDGDSGESAVSDEDAALAEALWSSMSGYSSWNQLKDWTGVVLSADGTHGDYVQIWANDAAYDAILKGDAMPDGAILVKEGYDDDGGTSLKGLTAMQKIDGYDADNGDWFWAQFDADSGAASSAGALSGCYGCHSAYSEYVAFDE